MCNHRLMKSMGITYFCHRISYNDLVGRIRGTPQCWLLFYPFKYHKISRDLVHHFECCPQTHRSDMEYWIFQKRGGEHVILSTNTFKMTSSNGNISFCEGNSPVTGEFPSQRPVTRSFDVFFELHLNKLLSKPLICRWLETSVRSLWRHSNVIRRWLSILGAWPSANTIKTKLRPAYWVYMVVLTHGDNMDETLQTTFSNALSWMRTVIFWMQCYCNLFPMVHSTLFEHCII